MRTLLNKTYRIDNQYFSLHLVQLQSEEGVMHIVNSNLPESYINELLEELNADIITKNNSPDTMAIKKVDAVIENWKLYRPISKYGYWDSLLEQHPEILDGKYHISTKLLYSRGWKYLYGDTFKKGFKIPSYFLSCHFLEAFHEKPNYLELKRIYRPTFEREIANYKAGENYVEVYSKTNQFYRLIHNKKDLNTLIAANGEFNEFLMGINVL